MDILLHFSPFLVKVPTGYVFATRVIFIFRSKSIRFELTRMI